MTEEEIISEVLRKFYEYEDFPLFAVLEPYSDLDGIKLKLIKDRFIEEKLVDKHSRDGYYFISNKGRRIVDNGGYLSYFEKETMKKTRSEKKEIWDFRMAGFKYYTFWPLLIIVLIEFVIILFK